MKENETYCDSCGSLTSINSGDGNNTVTLDTTITPKLFLEGIKNDLIREIQVTRKKAGYEMTDRIILCVDEENLCLDNIKETVLAEVIMYGLHNGCDVYGECGGIKFGMKKYEIK